LILPAYLRAAWSPLIVSTLAGGDSLTADAVS
jgi:hypothetical protein